jgi:hypothetical protein
VLRATTISTWPGAELKCSAGATQSASMRAATRPDRRITCHDRIVSTSACGGPNGPRAHEIAASTFERAGTNSPACEYRERIVSAEVMHIGMTRVRGMKSSVPQLR